MTVVFPKLPQVPTLPGNQLPVVVSSQKVEAFKTGILFDRSVQMKVWDTPMNSIRVASGNRSFVYPRSIDSAATAAYPVFEA